MGLFSLFKKRPKFTDELFGELGYTTSKDKSKNFYTGTVGFNSQVIRINLETDENGPTPAQKAFLLQLRDNYPSIKREVIFPFLEKELEDWAEEKKPVDWDDEFPIEGISIPKITDKPIEWSLTLYSLAMHFYITIDFEDMKPKEGTTIDG
jgi:hypothetical protein